jgi:hypothetical protein
MSDHFIPADRSAESDAKRQWRYDNELASRKLVATAIMVWGSLYVACVFVAGQLGHAVIARDLAIAAATPSAMDTVTRNAASGSRTTGGY